MAPILARRVLMDGSERIQRDARAIFRRGVLVGFFGGFGVAFVLMYLLRRFYFVRRRVGNDVDPTVCARARERMHQPIRDTPSAIPFYFGVQRSGPFQGFVLACTHGSARAHMGLHMGLYIWACLRLPAPGLERLAHPVVRLVRMGLDTPWD